MKKQKFKTICHTPETDDMFFEDLVNDFIKDKKVISIQCEAVLKNGTAYPIAYIMYEDEVAE